MQEHSSLRRRLFVLLLAGYTCAAWSQQSPCPFYPPPTVEVSPDVELVPQQPVPLPSLLRIKQAPGREVAFIGMCIRRDPGERELWDLRGVAWQKPANRSYEIACMDVAGTPVASVGGSYGTKWSAVSIVFTDKAREKIIRTNQWGTSYVLVGDDISFGAWACPGPFTVSLPVGFDPNLAMLSPQFLWPDRTSSISEREVLESSQVLHRGFATGIVADGTSAALIVYRVGLHFDKPVQLTLSGSSGVGAVGKLEPFDATLLSHGTQGGTSSISIDPAHFTTYEDDTLGQTSKFAIAVYRSPDPDFILGGGAGTVTITAVNGEDTRKINVALLAPPVVLLHGLWGGLDTFASWPANGSGGSYPAYMFLHTVYHGEKKFSDEGNQAILRNAIRSLQSSMMTSGVIGSRVDIVSHSMGGLMARQFMNSKANSDPRSSGGAKMYGTSPIFRLVTLDTPHTGSPLADVLWDIKGNGIVGNCNFRSLREQLACIASYKYSSLAELVGHPIDSAIEALGSRNFNSLILASPTQASGGFMAVSGIAPPDDDMKLTIDIGLALFGFDTTVDNIFSRDGDTQHDVIVGLSSQKDFQGNVNKTYSLNHVEVTKDSVVMNDVLCFLSGGFCPQGLATSQKGRTSVKRKTLSGPEWTLDLSTLTPSAYPGVVNSDAALQYGNKGSIYITVSGKAIKAAYLAFESSALDRQLFYLRQPNNGFDWVRFSDLPVPQSNAVHATFLILFDDNTYGVYQKDFPVVAGLTASYTKLHFLQDFIELERPGDTFTLQLVGNGSSGQVLLPATVYPNTIDTGADVVSLTNGVITALKEGEATITVSDPNTEVNLTAKIRVGNPIEPVVAVPNVAVSGVDFVDHAPVVQLSTTVNTSKSVSLTLSNTGSAELQIGAITWQTNPGATLIQNNLCTNAKLANGATCTVGLRFAPTAIASYEGMLAIATNDPRYENLPIRFIGVATAPVVLGTAAVNVAGVSCSGTVGQVSTCTGTASIVATGGTVTLASTPVMLSGNNPADFKVAAGACSGVTLAQNASCSLGVITFTPSAAGTRTAALSSSVTQGTAAAVTLSGIASNPTGGVTKGIATVMVTGVSCTGTVGQPSVCTGTPTIKAVGGPVKLNTAPVLTEGAQAAEFVVGAGACGGMSLAADAACTLGQVTFTAGAAGVRSALLTSNVVEGTSAGSTLTGTGNAPPGGGSGGTAKGVATVNVEGVSCSGTVGQAATCTGTPTIKAVGGAVTLAATPVAIEGAQASEFTVAAGACAGANLAADGSCSLGQVTFTAAAAGARSATLTSVVTDGTGASATLAGTGSSSNGGNTGGNGGTGNNGGNSGGGGSMNLVAGALLLMFRVIQMVSIGRRRRDLVLS